jgi:site-specific recombinase XerD
VFTLRVTPAAAVNAAPDPRRWEGRRDRVMVQLAIQTDLRVSELTGLTCGDVTLGEHPSIRCLGKGRRQRVVPLDATTSASLRTWLAERGGRSNDPLFCTRTGRPLSRDAVALRLTIHARTAAARCPTLAGRRIHPHVLRHTCAMTLLQAGVDTTVIALWLGHAGIRSTDAYVHADIQIKERALALTTPATIKPGRYRTGTGSSWALQRCWPGASPFATPSISMCMEMLRSRRQWLHCDGPLILTSATG